MKTSLTNLGRVLSKTEQQHINGGGTCQYYSANSGLRRVGLSRAQAINFLHEAGDRWCCDSCGTASWADAPSVGPTMPKTVILN
ncbi:hypothetical protein HN014_08950 [Aquimarina sp. TRL1]|uniref:hypothetical protein n=1 Tax=Aquimarina sp. (strain TRL1) TaxID=2736252 RepID=UPI001589AF03|nr:hypothetical protein [Aquimarina sp. TRL1]QKX05038.1 hypothetical protein HN014_08950 [Aquimarina sp. TRL1]